MQFKQFLLEQEDPKSFWDLVSALKLDAASEKFHDALLPWVNKNSEACINKGIKNKAFAALSHLKLYLKYVVKVPLKGATFNSKSLFNMCSVSSNVIFLL